jgi:hypothetical protein
MPISAFRRFCTPFADHHYMRLGLREANQRFSLDHQGLGQMEPALDGVGHKSHNAIIASASGSMPTAPPIHYVARSAALYSASFAVNGTAALRWRDGPSSFQS